MKVEQWVGDTINTISGHLPKHHKSNLRYLEI